MCGIFIFLKRALFPLVFLCGVLGATLVFSLDTKESDAVLAQKYFEWAQGMANAGRWSEARAGLERSLDFADVSSDIPYLLALARQREGASRGLVLEAVELALACDRWRRYTAEQGTLLRARLLVGLRKFTAALESLAGVSESAEKCEIQLSALKGLDNRPAFDAAAALALDVYPRNPVFVRIIFTYFSAGFTAGYATDGAGGGKLPERNESDLVYICLRRLPLLIEYDPELAYLAAPFIPNVEEAKLLVAAYLAAHEKPNTASIPVALSLGLIDEQSAVDSVFSAQVVDKDAALSVWNLCTEEGRTSLRQRLLSWTGVITVDMDKDGVIERWTSYRAGRITLYREDADQDNGMELIVRFENSIPVSAETGDFAVQWERYPAILSSDFKGARYFPKPNNFFFEPVRLIELVQGGVLYPEKNMWAVILTERTLIASAILVERDSTEFSGAKERIELMHGIPQRSREYLDERIISETAYSQGKPIIQKLDLDLDGVLETTWPLEE
ncbi:MAG: hypothetical protein LBG43_11635 [Treponema sp.]|nr:hypothetical protein [Treponema sp.]